MDPAYEPEHQQEVRKHERAFGGYLSTMIAYGSLVAVIGVMTALTDRELPRAMNARQLLVTAFAAQKLSQTITKDTITSPLRSPFTVYTGKGGPGEVMERPRDAEGITHSIGALLSCPFCFDVWVVTAFVAGHVFAPRATRMLVDSLAVLSGADFLQLAYAKAQQIAEG